MKDSEGKPLASGDLCTVVAGTHRGQAGRVEDLNVSKTGAETITVRKADGDRLKTLAKNVRRSS